jgi:4-hydroxy 2-oxovalerate aldolase
MTVRLLDCTLRDGGYYNDWDFTPRLVQRYLDAMARARVPIVEVGFRSTERGGYLGATAYTTDRYLASLDLPTTAEIGVMVNAKELTAERGADRVVDELFSPSDDSPVQWVRLAAHFGELGRIGAGVARLQELGYRVGVNLMQIASRTKDEVEEFAGLCREWQVDVAYFADSFGGMRPADMEAAVHTIAREFGGPVGCHTHDNMSMAFANTLAAIGAGAQYVDATVLGMGRGPGNVRTEYVAIELAQRGLADLDPAELLPIVTEDFAVLQAQYGWGTSAYYFLSAANNIHPTYIQEMTKDGRYTVREIVAALDRLGANGGASYSRDRLEASAQETESTVVAGDRGGSFDATGWCDGRDVLIVGPGPSAVERRADVESFIRARGPLVMALNALPPIDPSLVDAYAICDPVRAVIDAKLIAGIDRPLFLPAPVAERLIPQPDPSITRDYRVAQTEGSFAAESTGCTVPRLASFPYALALTAVGRSSRVLLTGFDGFAHGDPRQEEMNGIFEAFAALPGAPPVVALTRTSYRVEQSTLYAD